MLLQAGKLVELSAKRLGLTKAGQKALNEPAERRYKRSGKAG